MEKRLWKGGNMLYPVPPVMVSAGSCEHPLALTVAWTGTVCTNPPMTYISLRPERNTYPVILDQGCFVINLTSRDLVRAADFCGVKSGRDTDKFTVCGLTALPSSQVSAPLIAESPVNLECRLTQTLPLGSHHMLLAEIVAVHVREDLIENERLRLDKAQLVAYSHGHYVELGRSLGSFGFSVRKKSTSGSKRKKNAR